MRAEVEERKLMLDDKWNDYCNATVYYAYKMGLLSPEDRKTIENYVKKEGQSMFVLSYKKVKKYKIKDTLYWAKVKIEENIKKLVH